jgi:SAM-dependent methyltransferase
VKGTLLDDASLARSPIVANAQMNRERGCAGSNSYARELKLDPLAVLASRLQRDSPVAWLDLCCGRGRALIEAAQALAPEAGAGRLRLVGIDLVPYFDAAPPGLDFLELRSASVADWSSERAFDLITCVHGLHYVGDKLGLVARACGWLEPDGLFVANLDPTNLRLADGRPAGRSVLSALRRAGLTYVPRTHLLSCQGRKRVSLSYEYLGADPGSGPNYTGQAAVDSYYDIDGG